MIPTDDREVIILAAHCEECGMEMRGRINRRTGESIPFPIRVPIELISQPVHCPTCGGQAVFDLMGAAPEDPDRAYADYQDRLAER